MYYFCWFIRGIALVLLFEGASWASFDPNNNNDEPFKKALASFKEARTTNSKLKTLPADKPTCFISYAWGVTEQEQWVHRLDQHLREAGINTILDIRDNLGGTNTIAFVERIINPETDFVVLCGSKKLMEKLHPNNNDNSVVRLEVKMIGKRATWPDHKQRIIPLLLDGKHEEVLPSFLATTVSIGFQDPTRYPQNCFSLLKVLYGLEQSDISAITESTNPWELKTQIVQLASKFDSLINEVKLLHIENVTLKAKLASKEFKSCYGNFSNTSHDNWQPYTETTWQPIKFENFKGDGILNEDLTKMIIPEDGMYSLSAQYNWRAQESTMSSNTAIAINQPESLGHRYLLHYLLGHGHRASGAVAAIEFLKKGDKVMVSIKGHSNAQYHLKSFSFLINRIN